MAPAQNYTSAHVFSNSTLIEILDDLCVRFIVNLPIEELCSVERVFFQIEEAQWYYEDFVRGHNPSLPTLNLRTFASKIFQHCPSLQHWKDYQEQALNQFIAYKTRVPVRGAILLNHNLDQCVLVKGVKSSASWSFPRGKINQDETDEDCAMREVFEETGFDAAKLINPNWYIEQTMRSQNIRLYIIPGVPMDTAFAPRTRGEIGTIQWHPLSDLPTFRDKKKGNPNDTPKMGKFYMVAPFLQALRKWIKEEGIRWRDTLEGERINIVEVHPEPSEDEQDGVNLGDETSSEHDENAENKPPLDDSSAQLRSLLGIHAEAAREPPPLAQADAAAKLKYILSIGEKQELPPPAPLNPGNLAANGQILLSMLQGERSSSKTPPPKTIRGLPAGAQTPETPTRQPGTSASSIRLHNAHRTRQPLSPLYDAPAAEQPVTYTEPSSTVYQSSSSAPLNISPTAPEPSSPYNPVVAPVNPLFTSLQSHPKPPLTEQASALLATLKGGIGSSPPRKQQQPYPQPPPPKVPDTQQSLSLLSILKGEKQPQESVSQPQKAPAQTTQITRKPVPVPQAQLQEAIQQQQQPVVTPPQLATPPEVFRQPQTQQQRTPLSPPRGPRGGVPRIFRNNTTNPVRPPTVARTTSMPVQQHQRQQYARDSLPPIQTQQPSRPKIAPPVEPYLPSPVTAGGAPLNGLSPIVASNGTAVSTFDRRETTNSQQQQTLLALFKKPSTTALKQPTVTTGGDATPSNDLAGSDHTPSPTGTGLSAATARLQAAVKKMQAVSASGGVGVPPKGGMPVMKTGAGVTLGGGDVNVGGSQAKAKSTVVPGGAVTFAKDAFLMSYLEGVAKGAGK